MNTKTVQVVVRGRHLPGRSCGSWSDVHVGLGIGERAEGLVPADTEAAEWVTEVEVIPTDAGLDYRGPAVNGRRGERFFYLTWGELRDGRFLMFRRAKIMLADVISDPSVCDVAVDVDLTDERGLPRCARVKAPLVHPAG